MAIERKFVFVVCGSREHIDTLHFSLKYLNHFSVHKICVVTDSTRNETPVRHSDVIDVKTPEHLNHHQASIYLKTSLHKFLPKGLQYCYLDTDVVALNINCDEIFEHKQGVITFATDHCHMPQFSPSAVNCGCLEQYKKQTAELEALIIKHDPALRHKDPAIEKKKRALIRKLEEMRQHKLSYFFISLRFNLARKQFKLDDDTFFVKSKKAWYDKEGRQIIEQIDTLEAAVHKNSPYRWNAEKNQWLTPEGKNVYDLSCNHLAEKISETFGVEVADKNFQHWNGGVFLFDDSCHSFLESWFQKTMKIFELPDWKTRDQGTLIATVWELGMQNNSLLPQQFNFIADYNNADLTVDKEGNFSTDAWATKLKPSFVHIYHSFGKTGWPIWDYVTLVGKREKII